MTLWFVLALMTAAAIWAVAWPLVRRAGATPSGSDLAVYRDQLSELDRDRQSGRLAEGEAEAARVEVSRRLIAAADAAGTAAAAVPVPARRRVTAAVLLGATPILCLGLYLLLGSPQLPGQPIASRTLPDPSQTIEGMIAKIEDHLAQHPDHGRGWEIIAPVYLRLGRFEDAVKARRNSLKLNGETADRQADLGETLVGAANGTVVPDAKAAFERAIELDAGHVKARYFLGLAAEQAGRPADAATMWRAMVADAPANADWVDFVRREIARVQSTGPGEDDIAAASDMNPEQRIAMIRTMVDRLAERLHNNGSDIEGWVRLVRSYMVLGEREKAAAALADAKRALAGDVDKLHRIEELAKGLGLPG